MFEVLAGAAKTAALCLVPDTGTASDIRRAFAGPLRLPPVLPLSHLVRATDYLPEATFEQLLQAVSVGVLPADSGRQALKWFLYDRLSAYSFSSAAAQAALAQKLAALFVEVDDILPLAETGNPFGKLAASGSYEAEVASVLWNETATVAPQLLRRKCAALLRIADLVTGKTLIGVTDETTTPLEASFYEHCGILVRRLPTVAKELRGFLSADDSSTVTSLALGHITHCYEGKSGSLTDAAALALLAIRRLLAADADARIGVVVYDRLLARRLRALAAAHDVLINDAGGWRVDTLSFGAGLRILVNFLLGDNSATAIDDCLRPPFWHGNAQQAAAARQWRQLNDTESFRTRQTMRDSTPLATFCDDLQAARSVLPVTAASAVDWLERLQAATTAALSAWRTDPVAEAVWANLRAVAQATPTLLNGEAFRLWLDDALTNTECTDTAIDSPVEFVSPASSARFSAVVLLGCVEEKSSPNEGWLGNRERELLGLPMLRQQRDDTRRRFCRLLANHRQVAAVWRCVDDNGERVLADAFWRLVSSALHSLGRRQSLALPPPTDITAIGAPSSASLRLRRWPETLATSQARYLMQCPYRFSVQYLMRLSDDAEINEDELSPRRTGSLLHRVLETFTNNTVGMTDKADLLAVWHESVQAVAGGAAARRLQASYWLKAGISSFIEWEWQRRAAGWRSLKTEYKAETAWRGVRIVGRIDRLDANNSGVLSVLDYKSGVLPSKKDLELGEEPQLALNAMLIAQQEVAPVSARLLCQPVTTKRAVERGDDKPLLPTLARLRHTLRKIDAGASLPANAAAKHCENCPVAGVCRRPYWQQAAAAA